MLASLINVHPDSFILQRILSTVNKVSSVLFVILPKYQQPKCFIKSDTQKALLFMTNRRTCIYSLNRFIFVIRSLVTTYSISLSSEFSVESYLINWFKSTTLLGNRKWRNTINRNSRHYLTTTTKKLWGINAEKGRRERDTRTHARRPPLFQAGILWGQAINEGGNQLKLSCIR